METKVCKLCNTVKSIDSFPFRKKGVDVRRNECRECLSDYGKRYREKNRDILRVKYKERRANYVRPRMSKLRHKVNAYRYRDKLKGFDTDITLDWFLEHISGKPCIYCGDVSNIGCDRVDNSKGHTKSNCIPACPLCNKTRLDSYTVEEMKLLGPVIKKIKSLRSK